MAVVGYDGEAVFDRYGCDEERFVLCKVEVVVGFSARVKWCQDAYRNTEP